MIAQYQPMRAIGLLTILLLAVIAGCTKQSPDPQSALRIAGARTLSSFDPPTPGEKPRPPQAIKFEQAELDAVLKLYAEISGRSIIRAANLPEAKITFANQTPMTAVEILQALDTVLASSGITTVFLGTQYVKVVSSKDASQESGPIIELEPNQLPDSSSFMIYIVKVKNVPSFQIAGALQPFAKLPNSIIVIGSGGNNPRAAKSNVPSIIPSTLFGPRDANLLILRDYSSNVRRMLQVVEKLDQK